MIFTVTIAYFIQSAIVMKMRDDTVFRSIIMSDYNDFSHKFTEDDGFQVAFAVIDFGTADYSDVAGRQLEEYLNVKVTQ